MVVNILKMESTLRESLVVTEDRMMKIFQSLIYSNKLRACLLISVDRMINLFPS